MNIIILGAGQVGSTVATHLASSGHNAITVVDTDEHVLSELQDHLDIRTVQGFASYPEVLERAGANDAHMIIALTNSDETNMIACQVAYSMFHTPTKIARIRSQDYIRYKKLFMQETLPIDVVISPEKLVTDHIVRLIQYPGAFQVLEFAKGKVSLVAVRAKKDGLLVGQALKNLPDHLPNVQAQVAAIYRDEKHIVLNKDTTIEAGDRVFFIAAKKDIRLVMAELRKQGKPVRRVLIAGGGNVGFQLAKALERTNQVKIIERDRERAKHISEHLHDTIVLSGNAADEHLLTEENIDQTDIFVAVTNSEESNILSAMLSKRLGVKKVISLINKPAYAELFSNTAIDISVSPQLVTLSALLAHVRRGDMIRVHSLRGGQAEALEVIAHGDKKTSEVVGRTIKSIDLPQGVHIPILVRDEQVIVTRPDTVIESEDHVIVFMVDRVQAGAVEKLFQVGVSFI